MATFPTTRLIGGQVHYYFESMVVETPGDQRDYDEPITVTDLQDAPVVIRSFTTEEPIGDLRSSAVNGVAPGFWSPAGVVKFSTAAQSIARTSVGYVVELAELLELVDQGPTLVTQAEAAASSAALAAASASASALSAADAQAALANATAGAIRSGVVGSPNLPVYYKFSDEPTPLNLPMPHLLVVVRRTASA